MPALETSAWLADEWARQLAGVLASMLGESPSIGIAPGELAASEIAPEGTDSFWWEQRFSLAADARVWIRADTPAWREIGNRVLLGAGVDDGDEESIRSTYLEIVNQALSGLAGALSSRVRKEVTCVENRAASPPESGPGSARALEIALGELKLPLAMVFSSSLISLSDPPDPSAPDKPAAATKPDPTQAETQSAKSIDLLLDVELPVSISFGRAQLPLKEVIKLTTGSIVELNRALSEPVEVIVNNCVIARGEVVVVEGNYGIRIKQVVSRQERLRTLI